ncbi:MAG: hypothetical protein AAF206_27585, partial [Bacteroidota bacterium]
LEKIHARGILSEMDRDELYDHLLTEIEHLQAAGLATEEAFMIGTRRLGQTDMIHEEYVKAKPHTKIIQLLVGALAVLFGVKIVLNITAMASFSGLLLAKQFPVSFQGWYAGWGDLSLQIVSLLVAGILVVLFLRNALHKKLIHLWPLPVGFLLSEALHRFMVFLSVPDISPAAIGSSHYHFSIVIAGFSVLAVVACLWMMMRNRQLRLQLG